MDLEKATTEIAIGLIGKVKDFLLGIADTALNFLEAAAQDWRVWFVLGISMAATHFAKQYVADKSHSYRKTIIRVTSFAVALPLALYSFRGDQYVFEIALSLAVSVPFVFHAIKTGMQVVIPKRFRPKIIDKAINSKDYEDYEENDGRTVMFKGKGPK